MKHCGIDAEVDKARLGTKAQLKNTTGITTAAKTAIDMIIRKTLAKPMAIKNKINMVSQALKINFFCPAALAFIIELSIAV